LKLIQDIRSSQDIKKSQGRLTGVSCLYMYLKMG